MRIDVFSIFPEMVDHIADQSVIGRGRRDGHLDIRVHDLRQTTTDVHNTVDDAPFGGGAGMVMMPEPLFGAVEAVEPPRPRPYVRGNTLNSGWAVRGARAATAPLNFSNFYREHCGWLDKWVTWSFVVGVLSAWISTWFLLWNQLPHILLPVVGFAILAIIALLISGGLERVAKKREFRTRRREKTQNRRQTREERRETHDVFCREQQKRVFFVSVVEK